MSAAAGRNAYPQAGNRLSSEIKYCPAFHLFTATRCRINPWIRIFAHTAVRFTAKCARKIISPVPSERSAAEATRCLKTSRRRKLFGIRFNHPRPNRSTPTPRQRIPVLFVGTAPSARRIR
ncbi:hypothetical protein KCP73_22610 [Salmonella enterica subsp. enterica]|nr:hypothetical protein KCP73_22610 [Salmonella enterica subsp. enterica]